MNFEDQEALENAEFGISEEEILRRSKEKTISLEQLKESIEEDSVEYYEDDSKIGLSFKRGIDPQVLIDKIEELDS